MKISGNEVRPGNVLEHQGRLWVVTKTQHTQPGKGGAYMQVEMKDIRVGTKLNERFRSAESVERVRLDQRDFQFLFAEGDMLTFMDIENYDQIALPKAMVGESAVFLQDGMKVVMESHEGEPISVRLPETVTATVEEADPVVRGQTASSSYKPAKLDNGVRILVPPFIASGDRIKVSTSDFSYSGKAEA